MRRWIFRRGDLLISVIVYVTVLLNYFVFTFYGRETTVSFLTSLSAGVLGIFIAFDFERYRRKAKDKWDRKDLLRNLHQELETIKGTATTKRIYPDIWDSAI